jgi:hypothetical protein
LERVILYIGHEDYSLYRKHNRGQVVTTLNKPSSLIHEIQLENLGNWSLFKFSESLQLRMESLLEKKKTDQITPDEIAELDAIGELDRIFTHINAMLAAQNVNQS